MRGEKTRFNSELEARLHNPLLLWNGLNPLPKDEETPEIKQIQSLYKDALKQSSTRNLCMGLEVDFSDEDCGLGGFHSAGFVPPFFAGPYLSLKEDWEKDFRFYWPRDYHESDKYMSYLGSINLGEWPKHFHDLTKRKFSQWDELSFYLGARTIERYDNREWDIWMHLFVSRQGDFETSVPDCHVRFTLAYNFDRMDEHSAKFHREHIQERKKYSLEDERNMMINWQKTKTVETTVCAPKKFFKNIRPQFYWDGIGYRPDKEIGIFDWKRHGDAQIYGDPRSQQEAKRYLSPENYISRALTPMFSFNDDDADMTHQFYADACIMDSIGHKRTYCKLDSSCT